MGASWYALRKDIVMVQALANGFAACVEIQRAALLQEQPDIVVGSNLPDHVNASNEVLAGLYLLTMFEK